MVLEEGVARYWLSDECAGWLTPGCERSYEPMTAVEPYPDMLFSNLFQGLEEQKRRRGEERGQAEIYEGSETIDV